MTDLASNRRGSDRRKRDKRLRWVERAVLCQGLVLIVSVTLTVHQIHKSSAIVNQIQEERHANILKNCRDQDRRHDATVRELDARLKIARQIASPAQVAQIRQSRDFTVALIDALAPKRDCELLVAQQIPSARQR